MSVRARTYRGKFMYSNVLAPKIICQPLIQYNATIAISGAIKGTSQVKLYTELGLESLKLRRKLRHLCTFYKIKTTGLPIYLFRLIPNTVHSYQTRTMDNVTKY